MVDNASAGEQCDDFRRETFELGKDLERMTEQMENLSGDIYIYTSIYIYIKSW